MENGEKALRVACVLKSGGVYNPTHVFKLYEMIHDYLTVPHEFVCLTDLDLGERDFEVVKLKYGYTGWWSKLELFALHGPVFYFDLDTIIHKNIDAVAEALKGKEFVILRDFYRRGKSYGSGLMYWEGDMKHVLQEFMKSPAGHMRTGGGDQIYLEKTVKGAEFFQDIVPEDVTSFKVNQPKAESTAIVCFHGRPKPWDRRQIPYGRENVRKA